MAQLRGGKPYLYVTWIAQLLGGRQCEWRVWFMSRFKYQKYEEQAMDLVRWNREHNALMARRARELEAEGWSVAREEQNSFKLEGSSALLAGKPDLVATKPGHALVIDGKTGKQKDSDVWQVILYLFAFQKSRPDVTGILEGEVHYKQGDERVSLTSDELTPDRIADISKVIRLVSAAEPPRRVPSRDECRKCNIGYQDCPQRVGEREEATTLVSEF